MLNAGTIVGTSAEEGNGLYHSFASVDDAIHDDAAIQAYRHIEWAHEPPETYIYVVRLALSSGAYRIAQRLTAEGAARFPDSLELQKMSTILTPPVVRRSSRTVNSDLVANRNWLRTYRDAYRGRWVALRDGQLLGEAETAEGLMEQMGEIKDRAILVTRVY